MGGELGGVCMVGASVPRPRGLVVGIATMSPLILSGGVRDPCIRWFGGPASVSKFKTKDD